MTEIPLYELKVSPLRYIKTKKFLVKLLTFALFPKKFRKKVKKYLAYKLGIGEKPFSKKNKIKFEKSQQEFFKECAAIDWNKYQIISLGSSCLSRTLPTFWGLKPRKKDGEKSYPFDLCACNITGIMQNLQNDFAEYFDGLVWSKPFNHYVNVKKGIYYLHEDDLSDKPEDLETLHKRFKERINNFREALKSDKPIIFIFHYGDKLCCSYPEEFDALYTEIKKLRGDKPMSFFVVDTTQSLQPKFQDVEYYIPDFLPRDYVWHVEAYRYTKEGIRFESEMMQKLLKLVSLYQ